MSRLGVILVFVAALAAGASRAEGAESLYVKLEQADMNGRTGGPITLDVTMERMGQGLLEGRLEIVFGRDQAFASCESEDLALTSGKKRFEMILPPVQNLGGDRGFVDVDLRFRTSSGVIDLGRRNIFCPQEGLEQHSSLIVDPSERHDPATSALARAVKADTLVKGRMGDISWMRCGTAFLAPEEMPATPLAYCSYDVVALKDEGLAAMRERQLQALLRWVRAGGAAYVAVGKAREPLSSIVLKPYHIEFLNALAGGKPAFSLDERGKPELLRKGPRAGVMRSRAGLGRAVVVAEPDAYDSDEWKRTVCWLWKVPQSWVRDLVRGEMPEDDVGPVSMRQMRGEGRNFGQLPELLMPESAQLVPIGLVLIILAGFIVAVGPLDYFILGVFRLRRLTWVIFPALAVGGMLYMFRLTDDYMGNTDASNSVTYVDVGPGGETLRANRYTLSFPAKTRKGSMDVKDGFYAAVPIGDADRLVQGDMAAKRERGDDRPSCSGRMPTRYTAGRPAWKWTPQLSRVFTLDSPVALPKANWDALDEEFLRRSDRGQSGWNRELKKRLVGENGPPCDLCCVSPSMQVWIASSDLKFVQPETEARAEEMRAPVRAEYRFSGEDDMTLRCERIGLVASRFYPCSPRAAGDFDDLGICDATDPAEVMVALVTKDGSNWTVCRRVYYLAGE